MVHCEQAEKFAEYEFGSLEKVLETDLKSFGKGFSYFEQVNAASTFLAVLLQLEFCGFCMYTA